MASGEFRVMSDGGAPPSMMMSKPRCRGRIGRLSHSGTAWDLIVCLVNPIAVGLPCQLQVQDGNQMIRNLALQLSVYNKDCEICKIREVQGSSPKK